MKLINIASYFGFATPQQEMQPVSVSNVETEKLGPKEVYFAWETPGRPQKKSANQKLVRTFLVIGIVIALLLAIMGEFFLILVIGSLIFVSFVLSNTPPESVTYEISNHGVTLSGKIYYWAQLKDFFISKSTGTDMFVSDTVERIPGRLYLTYSPNDNEKIMNLLSPKLNFLKEEPTTLMDKAYTSFLDKFNFDK